MELIKDYPMAHLTSLGVGGPADYLCKPRTTAEIQEALRYARENNLPVTVIGYGSNLLVTDKGIRGLVIQLADNSPRLGLKALGLQLQRAVYSAQSANWLLNTA